MGGVNKLDIFLFNCNSNKHNAIVCQFSAVNKLVII